MPACGGILNQDDRVDQEWDLTRACAEGSWGNIQAARPRYKHTEPIMLLVGALRRQGDRDVLTIFDAQCKCCGWCQRCQDAKMPRYYRAIESPV